MRDRSYTSLLFCKPNGLALEMASISQVTKARAMKHGKVAKLAGANVFIPNKNWEKMVNS